MGHTYAFPTTRIFRTSLATVALFAATIVLHAAQVPEAVTRTVARHVLTGRTAGLDGLRSEDLVLARTWSELAPDGSAMIDLIRVYNVPGQGFAVVAADDVVTPVLGYSTEGTFPTGQLLINVAKWFEGYLAEVRGTLADGLAVPLEVSQAWQAWIAGQPQARSADRAVNPLLATNWNQSPHENALCPGGSVTGCVATAMAQVMKYHAHPVTGTGFHSYNEDDYGTLSANFGATTYDWAGMPNNVNAPNTAVATLMFHCGVGVDMNYSPQVSGAWMIQSHSPGTNHNSEYALKTYFGYDASMQGVARAAYPQQQWIGMLKADLDASRPVLYAGFGQGGGHCFVADGYDNNDFFHFNWGWGGMANGYFEINALNPGSTGTGGGSGGYNSGQEAIFGIRPSTGGGGTPTSNDIQLSDYVMPSASMLYYGQGFSVTANVVNNGSNTFNGDYCVGVFDANSNFYGFVQTLTGYNLPAGNTYTNGLTFTTAGLFSMLPGTYYLGVCYRPTGGEWVAAANAGPYTNFPQVTVINPNDMELNSNMTVTPGTSLVQGGQVSVNLDIANLGFSTFVGDYGVALYNLDGTWAQDIGVLTESNGLPSGYSYSPPYLTFGPVPVTVPPGTYLLALQHNPGGTGWQLTGSTYYTNPIFVTVTGATLSPDMYEVNDNIGQAYTLPVNFSGNTASVATTGANLHVTSDGDHYKVVLPAGYNYSISARAHDAYDSGNGNPYTADVLWSYSTDGSTWSAAYDAVMPGAINLAGGGTVNFQVAPYFVGVVGTYLLQLDITRSAGSGIAGEAGTTLRALPVPAKDLLTLDLSAMPGPVRNVDVLDMRGALVREVPLTTGGTGVITVNVADLPEGPYVVRARTEAAVYTTPIVIAR